MQNIILSIDGHEVQTETGKTILEAALKAGIYIPNLCYHPDLRPVGSCGLCVVEIDGRRDIPTSCTTPVENGMVVRTKSPRVERLRRVAAELMLSVHPADCSTCPKYGQCEFQSVVQLLGVTNARFRRRQKLFSVNADNPLFLYDPARCVLCGRCVRACRELRGVRVLDYAKKNRETCVATAGDLPLREAGCKFCGACVEVCPTGALRDHEGLIKTGVARWEALVPCRTACPAGIDIPRYIRLIRQHEPAKAAAVIREKVPFPLTLGYACNRPCETACRRREVDECGSIRDLKRFAAENDNRQWKNKSAAAPPSGRRVAVVGAGPAGLTAAYYLARKGRSVTVFEEMPVPGGMPRLGIPEYRLPTKVIEEEIREIEKAGVEIRTNTRIDSLGLLLEEGYNAVLVAVGAHDGVKLHVPGADLEGVMINVPFLKAARLGQKVNLGKRVVVLGGGNVAFDCARVARRLGAAEVHVCCLEARESMAASQEEIEQGEEEGILIHPSRACARIISAGGRVAGIECLEVASFAFDRDSRADIHLVEGSEYIIPADSVIFAVGQHPRGFDKFGLGVGSGKTVPVDPDSLASVKEAVFAAGDAVTGTRSVIEAVAAGRRAAVAIDRYLGGDGNIDEQLATVEEPSAWIGRDDGFAFRPRCQRPRARANRRIDGLGEVDLGYDDETARLEAQRCLQCDLRTMITGKRFWSDYSNK